MMMEKFVFTLLVTALGAGVGLSVITGWMHTRLARQDNTDEPHWAHALTKLGFAITNGILLIAVGSAGRLSTIDWRTWGYFIGLAILTVGLAWQAKEIIAATARSDVRKDVENDSARKDIHEG